MNISSLQPHELPGTIFMQPWWLDIVAKDRWHDITVIKGNQISARWPIVTKKVFGFTFIKMPILTPKLGPYIKHESNKIEGVHSNERKILKELIGKLPKHDYLLYNLNEDVTNYLPFVWAGFTQNSITSFKISFPFDPDDIWNNIKNSVRRNIRRARENLQVDDQISAEESYLLVEKTFEKQNKKVPYSKDLYCKLVEESNKRGRSTLIRVYDQKGKNHATQLFIHDDETTYYLVGGLDPDSKIAGAASLGMWEGISEASKRENSFDFEGSSIEPIENFFSSFGAEIIHFHKIKHISNRFIPIEMLKVLLRK